MRTIRFRQIIIRYRSVLYNTGITNIHLSLYDLSPATFDSIHYLVYPLSEPERQPDWPVGFPRGARASLFFYPDATKRISRRSLFYEYRIQALEVFRRTLLFDYFIRF